MSTRRVRLITASTTARYGDVVLVDATAGAVTITLPLASIGLAGITVKKTDTSVNAVIVTRTSPATIDGATSITLDSQFMAVDLIPDGTNWQISARVLARPTAPTIGTAVPGVMEAQVPFTPGGNGGLTVSNYTATSTPGSVAATSTASPITVGSLTAGTAYTFTVHATSPLGSGPESAASNSVTPTATPGAPGAPTIGTATADDTTATANWTAGTTGGSAITDYQIKTYDSSGTLLATDLLGGTGLTYTKTGLTNGTAVKFKVAAININGTGAQSAFSNTVTPNPFSPASLSNLAAWFKADALSLADLDPVATWTDSSSGAHNATQATSGMRPIYRTGILNGKPIVRWDGVTRGLQTVSFTLNQPITVFVVKSLSDTANGRAAHDGFTFLGATLNSGSFGHSMNAGASLVDATAADTAAHIFCEVFNGSSSNLRIGGGAGTSGNAGTNNPGGWSIGILGDMASQTYAGDIAEEIVYSRVLTLTEINQVGNFLATKYALTWTTAT